MINKRKRSEIEKIVDATGQLFPAYKYACKTNTLDIFYSFIEDNKLEETFFNDSFKSMLKLGNADDRGNFTRFVVNKGIEYLTKVYGNELGEKLKIARKNNKLGYFDIYYLTTLNKKDDVSRQAEIIGELLELYNSDSVVGIHRTGGWENSGRTINETGLNLTGHLSSGNISTDYYDVMDELEKNVSFSEKPGQLIVEIATGGSYKNILENKFVDISIIAIPSAELKKDIQHQDIIQNGSDGFMVLNPKYIKGYVTVDSEQQTLENYVENPKAKLHYQGNNNQRYGRETSNGEER